MLRIIINKNTWSWSEVLFDLPSGILEVLSLGNLSLEGYKIIRIYDPWPECIVCLLNDLVFVLSFGFLILDWE